MKSFVQLTAIVGALCTGGMILKGRNAARVRAGARLYQADGDLWGRIIDTSEEHLFSSGIVLPAVLVESSLYLDKPEWFPLSMVKMFQIA